MYIDISYPIDCTMAIYPGNPMVYTERVQSIDKGDSANVTLITIGSHTGTHIDAQVHFVQGGETIDQIPLERTMGKARVIDATNRIEIDADYLTTLSIQKDEIILFKTDNSLCWECDRILDDYVTLSYEAADYLADCSIKLVGIDYLSIERPRNKRISGKSVHKSLLEKNILICEALKLKDVCDGEYEFYCMPLNIRGADGCPVRCVLKDYN